MLLNGKTAVLTGCNKGIGLTTLKLFAVSGIKKIFACVRTSNKEFEEIVNRLKKDNNIDISIISLDLTNEENVKNSAKEIISLSPNIDILINNAGAISTSLFQMTKLKDVKSLFDTNFFSQYLFTQYILKGMMKNKNGSIIFISSTSAEDGNPGRSAYSASKSAINSLTLSLSKELGAFKIRVNAIAPGLTDTDMMRDNTSKENIEEVVRSVSLKRFANPEEISKVVLFLSSDLSSYMTGQVLRVDGGMK